MKLNKKVRNLGIIFGVIVGIAVGCSNTENTTTNEVTASNQKIEESKEVDTTKYFNDEGKEILEKNNKYDYEVIENFEPASAWRYEDKKIQITGKAAVIKDEPTKNTFEIHLVNNDNIIYVFIPKFLVNVNFKDDDVITVKGVYRGLENHDGYEFQINGYVIEKGNEKDDKKNETSSVGSDDRNEVQTKTNESKDIKKENKDTKQTKQVEAHKCFRCGKNATIKDGQWMCNDCYSEKIAHEEGDEEYVNTDDAMQDDGYFYCKGCGKQMTDNNGGTYACNDCLNNN